MLFGILLILETLITDGLPIKDWNKGENATILELNTVGAKGINKINRGQCGKYVFCFKIRDLFTRKSKCVLNSIKQKPD